MVGKNYSFMLISDLHSSKVIGCGGQLNQSGGHGGCGGYDLYWGIVIGCLGDSTNHNAYI